jgi:2,3-diaminopropionate biosynthesis protein SbnA
VKSGILSIIGNTPLVELSRMFPASGIHLFAKLEQFNPGGSIKDRPAAYAIQHALASGAIGPETVVIESSSGNMGIGLAQICAFYKLRFICVVDPKTTTQNVSLLKAYNAEVEMVCDPDPDTGEFLPARIRRVKELTKLFSSSFWPNQYASECNSRAHHQTMREIVDELNGVVDYLFCATSTCGTLRGCAEYKENYGLSTKIIAVDAVGSVIFGGAKAKRLIPGHGAAIVPQLYHDGLADDHVSVTDLECVVGCHRLAGRESFLAGGSSGAIMSAIEQYLPRIPEGAVCVAILPDRGERYLDTIYCEKWIKAHFGEIAHLWKTYSEDQVCETVTF